VAASIRLERVIFAIGRHNKGTYTNRNTIIKRIDQEDRVLAGLKDQLLGPDLSSDSAKPIGKSTTA